jgi:hypothetical protein
VSYIVGGGNTSALHPAFMTNYVWRSRVVLPPEPELREIVHDVVAATTDAAQLRQVIDELKGLRADFAEERAERTLKHSPYSSAWRRFAPETKEQWFMLIDILLNILGLILVIVFNNNQPDLPVIDHEQEIVQQLKEINEHLAEEDQDQEESVEQLKQINERYVRGRPR